MKGTNIDRPFCAGCLPHFELVRRDEDTPYSRGVLASLQSNHAVVPALWPFEIANVLSVAERRGRITVDLRRNFLSEVSQLSIHIEQRPALWLLAGHPSAH